MEVLKGMTLGSGLMLFFITAVCSLVLAWILILALKKLSSKMLGKSSYLYDLIALFVVGGIFLGFNLCVFLILCLIFLSLPGQDPEAVMGIGFMMFPINLVLAPLSIIVYFVMGIKHNNINKK